MTGRVSAWSRGENAVAFFAEIAELAIERWRTALVDEIYETVVRQLSWNRAPTLPDASMDERDAQSKQYRLFRERWGDGHPVRAAFKLVDSVAMAQHNPQYRIATMFGQAKRAGLDVAAVERIEIAYRLRDFDPDGKLTKNHRLAFEAAWIAGHRKFAVQMLRRSLEDLAA